MFRRVLKQVLGSIPALLSDPRGGFTCLHERPIKGHHWAVPPLSQTSGPKTSIIIGARAMASRAFALGSSKVMKQTVDKVSCFS